jgi:hypothetical protein
MANTQDIERCLHPDGEGENLKLCVLKAGHSGPHNFREVPDLGAGTNELEGGLLLNAFCPYCGSRPAEEGPGCEECGGGLGDEERLGFDE